MEYLTEKIKRNGGDGCWNQALEKEENNNNEESETVGINKGMNLIHVEFSAHFFFSWLKKKLRMSSKLLNY